MSRARCGILHAASQNRDRTKRRWPLRPRLCSAPLREKLRAALRPGHEIIRKRLHQRIELAAASREVRPTLPILLATGYADLPEGAQLDLPRLAKPYHQDQLRDRLDQLLG